MISEKIKTIILGSLILASPFLQSKTLDSATDEQRQGLDASRESQDKVDKLYDAKSNALQSLRITKAEIEQLNTYNRQLNSIISDQEEQKLSFKKQLKDIEITQQGIMPLMERMLTMLDKFIELDLPFLLKERQVRVATLRSLLLSSEVTISEKFRRVMEAYQIELEYGRTIEAYRSKDPQGKIVDFLRIGRVGLFYLGLNSGDAYAWNKTNKEWTLLDGSYKASIGKGLQIARKQSPPSLIDLPLHSIEGEK